MTDDVANRIRRAREDAGLNQSELARALGVSPQTVQQWEKGGGVRRTRIGELAAVLKVGPDWLLFGDKVGTGAPLRLVVSEPRASYPAVPPVLDWLSVQDFLAGKPYHPDGGLPCPVACGPRTFVLPVHGVSAAPAWLDGWRIFIDPDAKPAHGSDVVVFEPHADPVLRRMVVEGGERYLQVINPDFPAARLVPLDPKATIAGVVLGAWVDP